MAFASESPNSDWYYQVNEARTSPDSNIVPPAFHHCVWASEFCKDKVVLEIGCRSGFGTMILAKVAAKCTGMDESREAIKYALRNFYVEGKTKFVIGHPSSLASDLDVLVSLENPLALAAGERLWQLLSILGQEPSKERTCLFGLRDITEDSASKIVHELEHVIETWGYNTDYSIYAQSRHKLDSISEARNDASELKDAARIFLVIRVKAAPDQRQASISSRRSEDDLVSIVIPTYNRETLISQSIDSALAQTYPNVEVIVIDDGSKDNTKDVCAKYGDKIKYYYKQNGGIGSALNYGLKKMSGSWFKWLSSDDVLTPDAVEVLMAHAHETGAMIAYTDYELIDNDSKLVGKFIEPHFDSYYEYASALWNRFIGNGSSILVHKSCFDEVGLFDETLRSAEDYDWWLRACLLHGYRFFRVPRITLRYRTHEKQLTTAVKHNAYATDEKIRRKIKKEIISANPDWWETLATHQKLYSKQNRRGGVARRFLRRSLLHMPEGMRKTALNTWQKSVKPRIEE